MDNFQPTELKAAACCWQMAEWYLFCSAVFSIVNGLALQRSGLTQAPLCARGQYKYTGSGYRLAWSVFGCTTIRYIGLAWTRLQSSR